jgi:RNA polymerase sigma factor (sigma-70 family)
VTSFDDPTFSLSRRSYQVRMQDDLLTDLARRAVAGDRKALDAFLRELEPLITRTVRLTVGSGSWAAEDAAQEALLDLARGIESVREPEAALSWALRVATTRALKVASRERLVALRRATLADVEIGSAPVDERSVAVKDAFDRLSPALRATAVLRLYVGLSESETAAALSCSVGTVKSNLHDARRKLTATLVERGHAPMVARTKGIA